MARVNDKVYFVEGGVPGDVADILVEKDKKTFALARLYKLITPSPDREPAFCSHFGICGGCKWQNLNYQKQLELKAKQVKDAFERIGKIKEGTWHPILPSERTQYYRNKLEFTFSDQRWLDEADMDKDNRSSLNGLGFHIPRRFDKILDVAHCYLQPEPSNAIRLWVRQYAEDNGLTFFNLRHQKGLLRNLVIRITSFGELMVLVIFAERNEEAVPDGVLRPTWSDLKISTALNAIFWPSASVVHAEYLEGRLVDGESCRTVRLSDNAYRELCAYLEETFRKDAAGKPVLIPGKSYHDTDNFYESGGSYHAFNTCNLWANRGLKRIGVRTALKGHDLLVEPAMLGAQINQFFPQLAFVAPLHI